MHATYYPGHEHGCGHSNSCPHIGGASLGMLVQLANTGEEQRRYLHRQLDGRDKSNSELVAQVVRLEAELEQVKLELRLERQNKFATNKQKSDADPAPATANSTDKQGLGKRGAPVGHPGWHRKPRLNTMSALMFWLPNVARTATRGTLRPTHPKMQRSTCKRMLLTANTT